MGLLIRQMKCPKCNDSLEVSFNTLQDEEADYIELEFWCFHEHGYFVRVKVEDLIELD